MPKAKNIRHLPRLTGWVNTAGTAKQFNGLSPNHRRVKISDVRVCASSANEKAESNGQNSDVTAREKTVHSPFDRVFYHV